MEAATPPSPAIRSGRRPQRRLPLAQLLFGAAAVVLLAIGGAYALRFVSATAFHKERAFRVLDEIGSQLDNLQRTLANQLRLLPAELIGRQCALEFAGKAALSKSCSERRESYQRRLALRGPTVGVASVSKDLFSCACGPTSEGQLLAVAFQGSMAETVEGFVSQNFFDEVLVALGDGTVIATVPQRAETGSPTLQLHPARMRRLGVTNVASLLRQSGATLAPTADNKSAALPSQPEVLATRIADESYRVFIRAIQPRYGTYLEHDDAQPALRQERLFLVGLKREDLRAELASSMEPGGRFVLTILTLLAFLVWPLANLRSKSPDDAIGWSEAVACLAAVVLIPAVLAIATVWVWSYQGLLSWVDAAAARYAQSVATNLDRELQEGRVLLNQYRSLYRPAPTAAGAQTVAIPLRLRDEGGFINGRPGGCSKQLDRACIVEAGDDAGQWRAWTPFSSVFATDARGAREGERYTVYDPPLVRSDASYDNREYFRALEQRAGWVVTDPANGKKDSFVAQRLFSGSDGARVLLKPRRNGRLRAMTTSFASTVSPEC